MEKEPVVWVFPRGWETSALVADGAGVRDEGKGALRPPRIAQLPDRRVLVLCGWTVPLGSGPVRRGSPQRVVEGGTGGARRHCVGVRAAASRERRDHVGAAAPWQRVLALPQLCVIVRNQPGRSASGTSPPRAEREASN